MNGYQPRKFSTVIMDGTNEANVRVIISTIELFTNKKYGQAYRRALSIDHSTKAVIDVTTTQDVYDNIKKTIEMYYPGLCIFDPPMAV